MNRLLSISWIALLSVVISGGWLVARTQDSLPSGFIERSLSTPEEQRYFLEYVPPEREQNAPLVILLHGGGQSMRKLFYAQRTATRRWFELASRDGFVLVAPNGVNPETGDAYGDHQHWNDLRIDGGASSSRAEDVGFIQRLIERMASDYDIDPSRVYVTGASNGGMMAYRLLVEQPQLFASAAAFIANLPASFIPAPANSTPIFIANGTEDPLVPERGGQVARNRGAVRSTAATVAYWLQVNGLHPAQGQTRILPDLDPTDECRLHETQYADSQGTIRVVYLRLEGGGHYMPSASARNPLPIVQRLLGPHQCRDAEGADLAWAFLRQYRR